MREGGKVGREREENPLGVPVKWVKQQLPGAERIYQVRRMKPPGVRGQGFRLPSNFARVVKRFRSGWVFCDANCQLCVLYGCFLRLFYAVGLAGLGAQNVPVRSWIGRRAKPAAVGCCDVNKNLTYIWPNKNKIFVVIRSKSARRTSSRSAEVWNRKTHNDASMDAPAATFPFLDK